ncbi:MAG: hypothetical protein ACRD1G_19180 [Acidimicrobiales bacterium]
MSMVPGPDPPELNAAAIIMVLNEHDVRYLVMGAFAAIAQQAPIPATRDIDVTPEAGSENLGRLSAALKHLGARIRSETVPEGLAFDHGASSIASAHMWNLVCPYGELDVSFRPSGFEGGYIELSAHAHVVRVDGVEVVIADLNDVIRSKEAAGRPKDLRVLPLLYRHRATQRGGSGV